ncbi:MAG: hypothetical protein Kow0069_05520 [Promethearchaeota archaeon]
MDAHSHLAYGILVGELLWRLARRAGGGGGGVGGVGQVYNRVQLWLLGAFGGLFPDLDVVAGAFQHALGLGAGGLGETVKLYHRSFTHGLPFVLAWAFVATYCLLWNRLPSRAAGGDPAVDATSSPSPLGLERPEFGRANAVPLALLCVALLGANQAAWVPAAIALALASAWFALSFAVGSTGKPLYGAAFALAGLLHLAFDAFRGNLQVLGPWNPAFSVGLYAYPAATTAGTPRFVACYLAFETTAQVAAAVVVVGALLAHRRHSSGRLPGNAKE